jgi:RNA recognition motif-containing protein
VKRVLRGWCIKKNKELKQMEIYVGNLAYATNDEGLKAAFAAFGEVTAVRVVTDRMTGRSKGFGFVTMPDAAQAQAAIDALNGHELDGRTVRVNESQPKPREERGPRGGFGGRGGRGGFGGGRGGFGGDRPRRETRW